MPTFTTAELAELKTAYKNLLLGDRVVSVTIQGRTTTYAQVDADRLATLIERAESGAATSAHVIFTGGGKGL